MTNQFMVSIEKMTFENDALIAFIDLLGVREFYRKVPTEEAAGKMLQALLLEFTIVFSNHFTKDEIKENFDVSIFADSIVISPRRKSERIVERLLDFLLYYQANLFFNLELQSRAVLTRGPFFSLKIPPDGANPANVLGSQYTNISLCGGKGFISAHNSLEGLPMGVYITDKIKTDLSAEQKERLISVRSENLFIKQKDNMWNLNFLPEQTLNLLDNNRETDKAAISDSLKNCGWDEKAVEKILPWLLIHLGKQNEIIRDNK